MLPADRGGKAHALPHRVRQRSRLYQDLHRLSTGGATFHDVELFAKHVKPGVKIKAAGGISSLEDAEKFIDLGASRLGTNRVVKIVKKLEAEKQ